MLYRLFKLTVTIRGKSAGHMLQTLSESITTLEAGWCVFCCCVILFVIMFPLKYPIICFLTRKKVFEFSLLLTFL